MPSAKRLRRYEEVLVLGQPCKFLNYTDDYLGVRVSVPQGRTTFWAIVPIEWISA